MHPGMSDISNVGVLWVTEHTVHAENHTAQIGLGHMVSTACESDSWYQCLCIQFQYLVSVMFTTQKNPHCRRILQRK